MPRHRWWLLVAAVLALVVAVPAVGAITGPTPDSGAQAACTRPTKVDLAVDPALAAPVAQVVARTVQPELGCVHVNLSTRPSAEVAAEITRRSGQGLAGGLPDLWLPVSRLWLAVARGTKVGAARLPDQFETLASSPVVVALPASKATAVRWPASGPPIGALLASPAAQGSVALADPTRDAAGLATLLQVGEAAPAGQATARIADFARRVRVLRSGDPLAAVAAGRLGAVTTTEREVVTHDAASGAAPVVGYSGATPAVSEVPLVVVRPGTGSKPAADAVRRADEALRRALLTKAGQRRLEAVGFRGRDGQLAARYTPAQGLAADRVPAWTTPPATQVRSAIGAWGALGRRGRVLVTVDSSGSMAGSLPGSRTTKSGLARSALSAVVSSIAPDSDMGLWSFTSSRGRDYRVLVPLGPADAAVGGTTRRQALLRAIGGLGPVPGGGTGLYDTTLAAFRSASRDYAYGRLNAVMVITDGRNEDPGSVSLGGLLSALRREFDGIKPVRIITVAYGGDADLGVLKSIADVTGGASYRAPTAADVAPLLAKALADL